MNSRVTSPDTRGVSVRRVATLTGGLALAGAAAGGLSGGLAALLVAAIGEGALRPLADPALFAIGTEFGAPLGAVLLPIAGWALMRRVPLGRALVGTIAGTLVGGLGGWFIALGGSSLASSISGGLVGFAAAVFVLRRFSRARREASMPLVSNS